MRWIMAQKSLWYHQLLWLWRTNISVNQAFTSADRKPDLLSTGRPTMARQMWKSAVWFYHWTLFFCPPFRLIRFQSMSNLVWQNETTNLYQVMERKRSDSDDVGDTQTVALVGYHIIIYVWICTVRLWYECRSLDSCAIVGFMYPIYYLMFDVVTCGMQSPQHRSSEFIWGFFFLSFCKCCCCCCCFFVRVFSLFI